MIEQFIRTFTDLTSSRITCSRAFLMLIITNDARNILFVLLKFKHFIKNLLHTISYPLKILESFPFFAYFLTLTHFSFCFHTLRGWDKSPSLSIAFGLSSKTQWLSGLYYADFISFYSPTQLCGGGTTKSNSNELPISVLLSFIILCFSQCLK